MSKMQPQSEPSFDQLTWGDHVDRENRVTADDAIICPFTIITDTREQAPWQFTGMRADSKQKYRPLIVPIERRGIPTGDYSIVGHESAISIERKSPSDAFSTFATEQRNRFERELERLQAMTHFACVCVECEISELIRGPRSPTKSEKQSEVIGKTVYRSVIAWQQRFRGVHWMFLPGRQAAERFAFRAMERYWADRQWEKRQAEKSLTFKELPQ